MKQPPFFSCTLACCVLLLAACNNARQRSAAQTDSTVMTNAAADSLPGPYATDTVKNFSKVIGWPEGKTPLAPAGFVVTKFADSLENPRWLYVLPNGDVLVAEAKKSQGLLKKAGEVISGKAKSESGGGSADRITLLRDADGDGRAEVREVFLKDLHSNFGMLVLGNQFYVANTDALLVFPYQQGKKPSGKGKQILALPAGGYNNHWTRNIIASNDGSKIYVSVGSGSNVAENGMENEARRACIIEINPDGSGERIFASGLRNPVGMDWAPGTQTLYTVVNERDNLGDDLVPDYLTAVKDSGFYGWPWYYWGQYEDPRLTNPDSTMKARSITPDLSLGSHTASLGLVFYDQQSFPEKYHNGAFIGQRGSWNRSSLAGYKVVFVPFAEGRPGQPEDFLTGFIADAARSEVYGRPVGLAVLPGGALLVADDAANTIWQVRKE
ncbi:sorbosone dehydrogenase family protein [Chitinophaga sp.]|uniref:PQQ-dependent sugar dehydrogenase n=1 Tax=Chitinophaga sp. TaxID=1869181 RepID=UPI0031CED37F